MNVSPQHRRDRRKHSAMECSTFMAFVDVYISQLINIYPGKHTQCVIGAMVPEERLGIERKIYVILCIPPPPVRAIRKYLRLWERNITVMDYDSCSVAAAKRVLPSLVFHAAIVYIGG